MVEIVAEISGNHNGKLEIALQLIEEARLCGCDYVKFQYYIPGDMPDRHVGLNWDLYHKLAVPDLWLPELFACAKYNSIGLFASVFSARGAKEILNYDVPYIKLASPDSTRLASEVYDEIANLTPPDVDVIWSGRGPYQATMRKILYCPEGHPPTITQEHFTEFRRGNYWGFSDHTPGIRAPLAFIRAGAEMIEKHLKLKGDNNCVDALFSAEPLTMKQLCRLAHNK